MIISHFHRFILFHNPKTAGMSLRSVLAPYHDDPIPLEGILRRPPLDYSLDFAHLRLWEISTLFPRLIETAESYRSVVFVRNPYRRFISAVDQHFKTYYRDLPIQIMRPVSQMLAVETFVDRMLRVESVRTDHRFVHFSPQTWYLQSGGLRLSADIIPMDDHGAFIVRAFECLGLPDRAVPHDNRSQLDLIQVLISPKIRAFVRDFYADDFAFFAADPVLAPLADEPKTPGAGRLRTHQAPGSTRAPDQSVSLPDLLAVCAAASRLSAVPHQPIDVSEVVAISEQIDRAAADLSACRPRDAFERVRSVLAKHADYPRALGVLGQIAVFTDHPAAGLAPLQRAAALDPRLEHRVWLALCLAKLGCAEDAVRVITACIETIPPTGNAHFAVAMVFHVLGLHEEAARFYGNCIALDAGRTDARHRYARALQAAGQTAAAIDAYMEVIRNGSSAEADYHTDLSSALSDLGRFEEARIAATTAVGLNPACAVALNNLGHALQSLNRSAEAVLAYEKAIELCDTYAKARLGHALALLKCGNFERGWQQYEWRWQNGQMTRPDLGVPVWRGEDVSRRTILLCAEQGLGDTLQFVRFAPLVASRGARVVLEVPAPLVRLLRCVDGVAEVIAAGDRVPPIDLHCPMASLPLAVGLRLETIPASPYLHVAPRERVQPGLVVGLVWAGDPRLSDPSLNLIDRRRSTTLDVLAPLFDVEGVRFVSFQFGEARAQLAATKWPIIDAMDGVTDFADTAARLATVDLLISVDTSMVHLAGGLGMKVWMLSRFDGCWRWLEQRSDTPWYPSMRIFRQPSPGDWSSVVADVGAALRTVVRDGGLPPPTASSIAPIRPDRARRRGSRVLRP
jgi:tetratricopeptide (TPR) repeat protein